MALTVMQAAVLAAVLCALACAVPTPAPRLLGTPDKVCTWGPSYWCKNITTAKGCGAVRHCIQTVWEHMTVPEDNDDVCTVCKNMVKQARDQLQSNETQEELREVFEGSCNLIPLKPVAKGCDKLVDEFIPELVETLASQMNPDVVCSVAGLCNNAEIDRMLAAAGHVSRVSLMKPGVSVSVVKPAAQPEQEAKSDCNACSNTLHKLQRKLMMSDRDDLLNKFLEGCGMAGSLSDGCSAVVVTNFPEIMNVIQKGLLSPAESCELMQYCSVGEAKESHVNVDVVSVGQVGIVPIGDNMTCQFCERMVQHLRDILVANTTETEFQQVLVGLCKQMKSSIKDECLSVVTEYYGMIYNFLVNNLDGKEICSFAGLCPSPGVSHAPIWPLLPAEINVEEKLAGTDESSFENPVVEISVSSDSAKVNVADPSSQQLPLERMVPHVLVNIGSNKEICAFCEYFLHFVQTELASEKGVEKVKSVVEGACEHLPATINSECKSFVDAYGSAFVALIVQEVDPSIVCPGMGFCPSKESSQIVLVGSDEKSEDKPGCPLCLLAVTQLEAVVKDNKTEESLKAALESLCVHLPKSLVSECDQFVDNYSKQLIDAMVADFSPQEVCVYIALCDAKTEEIVSGDVFTNEIPQYEDQKLQKSVKQDPQCVICEFALARIESMLKKNSTEEEIKHVVHKVCNYLPKTVSPKCNKFVDQYADLIITLLSQELDPKLVCTELALCSAGNQFSDRVALSVFQQRTQKAVEECSICEAFVQGLSPAEKTLEHACEVLPARFHAKCINFIEVYGPSIMNIMKQTPGASDLICSKIGVCVRATGTVKLIGARKCSWGPGYWCQSEETARACGPGTVIHCQENVWKGLKPSA